ncbi:alpha/beta hydrolase [Hymenobacter taeanensis]|uniref:Alpha/beta hydrolase n=1 Tax=Hymenobacter taeanensis TaxID=2735321 RepID=A0A6M6BDM6_9BACT|nr:MULTISPECIES: alpha/beta hydrolase [Hymenobacter]QJX45844.1 alpha/beta hydrolase [Hymenobacter taeanensis]UOQ79687.1 alpha/beta hydrolase [Hymenobacter sp. 5414T-23]
MLQSEVPAPATYSQYVPDILGEGFEQLTITPADSPDYEGDVFSTLVRYQAAAPTTRAVLYVHGFNDYFFQRELAQNYGAHQFNFYALDLRKYGRSIRPHQRPNNVRDLREYFHDLHAALARLREEGNTTIVLSGHSTGGLITSLYVREHQEQAGIAALVLNSPFLEMHQPWLLRKIGIPLMRRVGARWPDLQLKTALSAVYGESLHRSYRGEWDYNLEWKPNQVFGMNAGWLRAIRWGHAQIRRSLNIKVPVLVLHSDRTARRGHPEDVFETDVVLNVAHIRELSPWLGSRVTEHAVEGAIHDVFLSREKVRTEAYRVLFEWLGRVLPAA